MARNVQLLLTRSVENLGIVGDMVKVKPGFARNYLLPHRFAEFPTPKKIESLKEARAAALAELAALRKDREGIIARMQAVTITLKRSCNDQGVLYGSVTQRDLSDSLIEAGYAVDVRSVRLSHAIRRVGSYQVPIQFERDLRTDITVVVEPDRTIEEERPEMEFDDEGNLIEPGRKPRMHRDRGRDRGRERGPRTDESAGQSEAGASAATAEPPAKPKWKSAPAEKAEAGDKPDKPAKAGKAEAEGKKSSRAKKKDESGAAKR
jgi:large subunit ribosomal protein L9